MRPSRDSESPATADSAGTKLGFRWFLRAKDGGSALAVLLAAGIGFGTYAADTPPLQKLKQRSASQRFEKLRKEWRSDSPVLPIVELPAAPQAIPLSELLQGASDENTPGAAALPDVPAVAAEVVRPELKNSASAGASRSEASSPVANLQGSSDSHPAPQTLITVPDPYQNSVPGFVSVPPGPDDEVAGNASVPAPAPDFVTAQADLADGTTLPQAEDPQRTIFRPISQIQPYYNYSPTAKQPHEYICPRPEGATDDPLGRCPEFIALPARGTTDRYFAHTHFQWAASNLYHKPLYFEDVQLERYGHVYPPLIQPFASVGKFGIQLIGLPYQMALDPVCQDQYVLGYYRPGDCAPYVHYRLPLNAKAAAAAAGVYTGLIFLFP